LRVCFIAHKAGGLFLPGSPTRFGGAEVQISWLAQAVARDAAFEVHAMVAEAGGPGPDLVRGVRVWRPFALSDSAPRRAVRLLRFLATAGADVYVQRTLSPWSGVIAAVCRLRGAGFVYMTANDGETDGSHIVYRRLPSRVLSRLAFRLAGLVVIQNAYQREHLRAWCATPSLVLPASWELPEAEPAYDPGSYVLWVGRIDRHYKQPELFLELARRFPSEAFRMLAPAANDQSDYHARIAAEAAGLPNVTFLPDGVPLDETAAIYRGAKALVNTSRSEGFPNTYLQAALAKTPIISLNADPDSFIHNYRCGFSCGGDFELLARRLGETLRDERLRAELAANAYRYAVEHHDVRANAARLADALRGLRTGRGAGGNQRP
jgi:glycosyltransferase involved in cell wall biosynthesis